MKKRTVAAALIVSLLFCALASFGWSAGAATSITQDQEQLSALEAKAKSVKSERAALTAKISSLQGEYENNLQKKVLLENDIQLTEAEIATVGELIAGYEQRLNELKQQRYEQETKLEEYYSVYAKILNYYYKYGNASSFELLLMSDGISDFMTRLDYLKYVMEYNNTITDSIKIAKENSDVTKALYEQAGESLTAEQSSLEVTKSELITQTAELEALNTTINGNLSVTEDQLRQYKSLDSQLEADIIALNKQIAEKYIYTETDYAWPIDSVYWSDGGVVITCKFGNRISPITGREEFHNGLDIAAPYSTPIQAVKSGTVIRSENSPSWGNVIVIAHGDGTSTLYAHCSKLLVSKGATVMQGQVIARVGSTGLSTGNHLHFTIYKNDTTVNPADYLDANFITTLNKRGLSLK